MSALRILFLVGIITLAVINPGQAEVKIAAATIMGVDIETPLSEMKRSCWEKYVSPLYVPNNNYISVPSGSLGYPIQGYKQSLQCDSLLRGRRCPIDTSPIPVFRGIQKSRRVCGLTFGHKNYSVPPCKMQRVGSSDVHPVRGQTPSLISPSENNWQIELHSGLHLPDDQSGGFFHFGDLIAHDATLSFGILNAINDGRDTDGGGEPQPDDSQDFPKAIPPMAGVPLMVLPVVFLLYGLKRRDYVAYVAAFGGVIPFVAGFLIVFLWLFPA